MLLRAITCILFFLTLSASTASAHFGMVIPSKNIITPENKSLRLTLSFSHPFEMRGMDLSRPHAFYMRTTDKTTDLLPGLQPTTVMGRKAWRSEVTIKRPGVYWFVMEPAPYWESAEDIFILHYTKTAVAAFGDDEGWDAPMGLPVEIVPLTRPFGNYAGNSFTGRVLQQGKPVANTPVEVELYNRDKTLSAPSDYHITQVVRTDDNGIFTFTCPRTGWWGFAALLEGDKTVKGPDGKEKDMEMGAVLWTYMDNSSDAKQ
jgi:cobalt/nickel transport protein